MPSIYDIAQACATSPATVSRVINGRPGVKPETAQRIRLAMDAMKFQPRWSAADRNNLLVLVPSYTGVFKSGFISLLLSGIADAAFRFKLDLALHPFDTQRYNCRELRQFIAQKGAVGCLFISQGEIYQVPDDIEQLETPYVVLGRKKNDDGVRQVWTNSHQAGADATSYLVSLGHRDIALVGYSVVDRAHHEVFNGFQETMRQAGLGDRTRHVQFHNDQPDSGRSAARQLLSPHERPTAVIISNDNLAAGFLTECREMGVRIPEALSVIAFETASALALAEPPLTVMQSPLYTCGVEAVKLLLRQVEERSGNPPATSYTTTPLAVPLIVRRSTAARHE